MSKNSELHIKIQDELLSVINQVQEGELSNLDALIIMRQNREQAEKTIEITKEFETERLNQIATDAEANGGKYCGFDIKAVNGKKLWNFKGIPQLQKLESEVKETAAKFVSAFDGFQKGTVQTTEVDGVRMWIDENGEVQPFPELSYGKSYLTVTKSKEPKK